MKKINVGKIIESGDSILGIELGSTRIKAILIDTNNNPIASGNYDWENSYIDDIWTYSLEEVKHGLSECYKNLKADIYKKYGVVLKKIKSIGISAMMHGFIALDRDGNLLTPFRTWRNNITSKESETLTNLFNYPVPQRWSISHLLYSINRNDSFLKHLDSVLTLSAYVHKLLSGENVIGIGDASGMFPIDIKTSDYDQSFIDKFDNEIIKNNYKWKLRDVFPKVLLAGDTAGFLTAKGATLLDLGNDLIPGSIMCPPEGDAATGMVATNSVLPRTGNVSAGTSVFSMIVLEKTLANVHKEIDLVSTPDGKLVAMAHSNNCTSEYDSWIKLFKEVIEITGNSISTSKLYDDLLNQSLLGDYDCGDLIAYNYLSGEHVTGFSKGVPLFARTAGSNFNLANFMRVQLYSSLCSMKIGLNILFDEEKVNLDYINGHGGFFKTAVVGQKIMADAFNVPCSILSTAGEGGAWGIALLAAFVAENDNLTLSKFLETKVFNNSSVSIVNPNEQEVAGFNKFFKKYLNGLKIERTAVEILY
ncbi:MAG: xylulokinase [Pleomorphochaeta sp.]